MYLFFPILFFFYSFECITFSDFDLQIPSINILRYTTEVLGVILALLDDSDDSVQLTAVTCLLMVFTLAFLTVLLSQPMFLPLLVQAFDIFNCIGS